jgi:hypothetical protein
MKRSISMLVTGMALFTSITMAMMATTATAAPDIYELSGYLHADGALAQTVDTSSSSFTSTLDTSNLGSYGWTFTNTSGAAWNNVSFLAFLDAEIDRPLNTFFNEYGECVELSLPSFAPGGAIAATSWEIDEPGYLFGDIYAHLLSGSLDNAVGSEFPDDVSLALGFYLGDLAPDATATITLFTSLDNIGGLRHSDPDSGSAFYYNGYATVTGANPSPAPVPEPSTLVLAGLGLALCGFCVRRKK